jgi:hypothetical protein
MSNPQKKIGGEYGDVRASIDVDSLNAYLAKSVPAVKTPVVVKQFKVLVLRRSKLFISLKEIRSMDR